MEPRDGHQHRSWSRRRAVVAGAGAAIVAAGIGAIRPAKQAGAQVVRTGGGIAGGGQVKEKSSRTHFSVFASRFENEGVDDIVFVGSFKWVDGKADVEIESTSIEFYGVIEGGSENDRELRGIAKLNGEDGHPFLVRMADEDGPGLGKDTIAVFLGATGAAEAETDPIYKLEGLIDVGDLQLLTIDLPF
jgi:hypothetical protein